MSGPAAGPPSWLIAVDRLVGAAVLWFAAYVVFLTVRFMVRTFLADRTVTFEAVAQDEVPVPDGCRSRVVEFSSADGVSLRGTLIEPGGPSRGLVVFAPEFGGDQSTWLRYGASLPAAGYTLFTFDFRSGRRPGEAGTDYVSRKWCSHKEVLDLAAAVDAALRSAGAAQAGILGISRGGVAAVAVAAMDPRVAGVVVEGSCSTLEVIHTYAIKWSRVFAPERLCAALPDGLYRVLSWVVLLISEWNEGHQFPLIERQKPTRSGGPILFIYGERDRHVEPPMAKATYEGYGGPKSLWIVPRARHNQAVIAAPEEYGRRIREHFEACLSPS